MTIMVGLGLEFSTLDQQGPETHSVRLHLAQNMRTMVPPRAQRDAGQLALSTLKHLGRIDRRPGNFGSWSFASSILRSRVLLYLGSLRMELRLASS